MKTLFFYAALIVTTGLLIIGCEDNDTVEPYEPLPQVAFVYQPETDYNNPLQFQTLLDNLLHAHPA